jgi:hypothetical protein
VGESIGMHERCGTNRHVSDTKFAPLRSRSWTRYSFMPSQS